MTSHDIFDLSVQDLIPGMIISEDLRSNGTFLLKEGSLLNDTLIDRLKKIYMKGKVKVYIPEEIFAEKRKEIEIKKVEQAFQEVQGKLKKLFSRMDSLNENNISELRDFASKIEEQLNNSEIVLSRVLFKGDGDDYIYKHGVNVAVLSALLGKWIGLGSKKINLLIYAAMLHDFGITKLSKEIQSKPDLVTINTNFKVKDHVQITFNAVRSIKSLDQSVMCGILMHHERCDGSGYPFKLSEDRIHPFAKIIAIADEFDMLNSDKKFIEENGILAGLSVIKEMSLKSLDYKYAKIFIEHILNFYIGEKVRLSNGDVAKILQINMQNIESPLLLKDDEFIDLTKSKDLYIKELISK